MPATLEEFRRQNPGLDMNTDTAQQMYSQWSQQQDGLVSPSINVPALPAVNTPNANWDQQQLASQAGSYASQGDTQQSQSDVRSENTQQQQQVSGTTEQKSGVDTPFDLNALVNSQLAGAATNDAGNKAFLTDVRDTGGSQFGSQVDQAVRNSLSGAAVSGAGDSARARAAGYAGAQIGRNNLDQRMAAAQGLAGPNATQTALGSVTPLLGKTNSTTNTGTTNTSGQTSAMDLQSLVSQEGTRGVASGGSAQSGSGLSPSQGGGGGGGCVVCTAYVSQGRMRPGAIRRAVRHKLRHWNRYGTSLAGYMVYGPTLAKWVLRSPTFARFFYPLARATLYEEVRLSAPDRVGFRLSAYITHGAFDLLSYPVGLISLCFGRAAACRDEEVTAMLKSNNLYFTR